MAGKIFKLNNNIVLIQALINDVFKLIGTLVIINNRFSNNKMRLCKLFIVEAVLHNRII